MGLTLTEKILKAHVVDGEFVKGNEIGIRIDQTLHRTLQALWLTSNLRLWVCPE